MQPRPRPPRLLAGQCKLSERQGASWLCPAKHNDHALTVYWLGLWVLCIGGCEPDSPPAQAPVSQNSQSNSQLIAPEPQQLTSEELRQQAFTALDQDDVDLAENLSRAAVVAAPQDPQIAFLRALVLGKRNRFHEAIGLLDRVAVTEPDAHLPVLGQTAQWMVMNGQWQDAEQRFRKILHDVPEATLAHRNLAYLLLRQSRRIEAVAHLQEMCRLGDVDEVELRSLLCVKECLGNDAKLAVFDPIEHSTENSPDLEVVNWYARGEAFAFAMKHHAAVRCFAEVVIRDPTHSSAYLGLQRALIAIGNLETGALAADRARRIERTQDIGASMANSDRRDASEIEELANLLDSLQRRYEAISWNLVALAYQQTSLTAAESANRMEQIRLARERISAVGPDELMKFRTCGIDLSAFPL